MPLTPAPLTDNFRSAKVYDWQDYRDVCYQMYIKDRKVNMERHTVHEFRSDELQALEEIMHHMRDVYSFAPSKRAFQTQFRRWGPYQIGPYCAEANVNQDSQASKTLLIAMWTLWPG